MCALAADERLTAGAYLTRSDGGGGLFEVIGLWPNVTFEKGARDPGTALIEDSRSLAYECCGFAELLSDYTLVRIAT